MQYVKRKRAFSRCLQVLSVIELLRGIFDAETTLLGARRGSVVVLSIISMTFLSVAVFPIMTAALSSSDADAFADNRLLGRGINLGNALEAPYEGAWGVTLKELYFQVVKNAGFNSVRIPINWSATRNQNRRIRSTRLFSTAWTGRSIKPCLDTCQL